MRVLLLDFRTNDPYTVLLANGLAEFCDLTLLLPEQATVIDGVDTSRLTMETFHLPRLRQSANLTMARHLLGRINHYQPDVVHTGFWHIWLMPALALARPAPLISTVHDVERHAGERGLWAVPPFIYNWQWRWATQVIVHAGEARQQLIAQHRQPPNKVNVIPIGAYDFYHLHTADVIPEEPNTILFFGRIWGYKGLRYLIEAEPIISRVVPNLRIIIAGHGEPFDRYRQMMVNPDRFEIHNYRIPDEEVPRLFRRAAVVALPYIEASQSGVAPLAFAFGKPVVATAVGGLPDVVIEGETGYLVPPADADQLAQAIIGLLQQPALRQQMGRQAHHFAQTRLSWRGIAQQTINVYQKAVNSK